MKKTFLKSTLFSLCLFWTLAAQAQTVSIHRDKFGTPIIVAKNLVEASYGLGYAAAMDNGVHMARNYKMARGRTGEIDGQGALLLDSVVRSIGFEKYAIDSAPKLTGEPARIIDNYLAGANAALVKQKSMLPDWVEPFTKVDVLAFAQFINAGMALQELQGELMPSMGSNQFALSPKRTTTGHAMLSADPHLPWEGFFRWHEYGIETPEVGFHGVTFPGLPFPAMGHTRNVAWSMTNNNPRLFTIYRVDPKDDDATKYSYHGQWKSFATETYEMKYRDGTEMKTRKNSVKMTEWGPIIPFRMRAVKFTMTGDSGGLSQTLNMLRAKDGAEFRKALMPRGISMFNIVYADTKGNIGYQFNARIPKRDPAYEWRKTIVGADPKTVWGPLWSLDDLPRSVNPASGILVNCNSDPNDTWLGSEKVKPKWPNDVTTYRPTTRFNLLSKMLLDNAKMSVEQAKKTATDTKIPYAEFNSGPLADLASLDNRISPEVVAILRNWDGRAEINSVGASLYTYWLLADPVLSKLMHKGPLPLNAKWNANSIKYVMNDLVKAVENITKDHGKVAVPWGEMHYAERGGTRVPMAGFGYVQGRGGDASVNPAAGRFVKGDIQCSVGSSYRMIVDLDPKGIKSWTIIPFGNSSDPKSPHYADQMAMYGRREYKPVLFGAAALKNTIIEKLTIGR